MSWPPTAHPRSRGENPRTEQQRPSKCGSSPLTRGKPLRGIAGRTRRGLIPAHAGKTRARRMRCGLGPAHPRSRGENPAQARARRTRGGSSPLTRGKRAWRRTQRPPTRLIPAHAGKTLPWQSHQGRIPAHPRSRGENTCSIWRLHKCTGSSPLTRGKLFDPAIPDAVARLIPAHAGKTHHQHHVACHAPAHPRSRGENHA